MHLGIKEIVFQPADGAEQAGLKEVADRMTREALANMEQAQEPVAAIASEGGNGKHE